MDKVKTFFNKKQNANLESFKEFLRVLIFGVFSYVFTEVAVFLEGTNSKEIWIIAIIAGLRYADKWLHNSGNLKKGITRF